MRFLLSVGLIWLIIPPVLMDAAEQPIPQNQGRMEQQSRELLDWSRRTLVDEYQRVGKKNDRWNKIALEALEMAAWMLAKQEPLVEEAEVYTVVRRAIDAGCDDPLILSLYSLVSTGPNMPDTAELAWRLERGSAAMEASTYSPFRRASAMLRVFYRQDGSSPIPRDQRRDFETRLDAVVALVGPSSLADPRGPAWEARWFGTIREVCEQFKRIYRNQSLLAFDRVDSQLARIPGIEALRWTLRGDFYIKYAWEARTGAATEFVTPGQATAFDERLTVARAALEAAYRISPEQPFVAKRMLTVELGQTTGRAAMEQWFERAMNTDGNDQDACKAKLLWLEPKWHGDSAGAEMLAFGRACAATQNWRNGLELVAADSIMHHFVLMPPVEGARYLHGQDTWMTVWTVYTDYLKHQPADSEALSRFAYLAFRAGRVSIADDLFRRVGPRLVGWNGPSTKMTLANLEALREQAAGQAAQFNKQNPRTAGFPPPQ